MKSGNTGADIQKITLRCKKCYKMFDLTADSLFTKSRMRSPAECDYKYFLFLKSFKKPVAVCDRCMRMYEEIKKP